MTPVEERIDHPVFVKGIGPPLSQIREDHLATLPDSQASRDIVNLIDAYLNLLNDYVVLHRKVFPATEPAQPEEER